MPEVATNHAADSCGTISTDTTTNMSDTNQTNAYYTTLHYTSLAIECTLYLFVYIVHWLWECTHLVGGGEDVA